MLLLASPAEGTPDNKIIEYVKFPPNTSICSQSVILIRSNI